MSACFNFAGECHESTAWIRQVVKHADRECIIECASKRQPVDVCLNDVDVAKLSRSGKSCFNRRTQVNPYNISGFPGSRQLCVPALAATAFEHNLVCKKLGLDRCDPAQKLFSITIIGLGEVLPLPAKPFSGRFFVVFYVIQICKTRNTGGFLE